MLSKKKFNPWQCFKFDKNQVDRHFLPWRKMPKPTSEGGFVTKLMSIQTNKCAQKLFCFLSLSISVFDIKYLTSQTKIQKSGWWLSSHGVQAIFMQNFNRLALKLREDWRLQAGRQTSKNNSTFVLRL